MAAEFISRFGKNAPIRLTKLFESTDNPSKWEMIHRKPVFHCAVCPAVSGGVCKVTNEPIKGEKCSATPKARSRWMSLNHKKD